MRNLRYIFIIALFGFTMQMVVGQSRYFDERAVYSQHFISPYLVNPGAVGAEEHSEALFNYRNKWSSFEGSPSTVTFAYAGPVGNRLSLGAQLMRDSYGVLETNKGQVGLAYTIDSEVNRVSFGLSTELIQHRASGSLTNTDLDDPILAQRLQGDTYFDASFGIYGTYNGNLTYGLAFPSLVSSRVNEELSQEEVESDFGYIINFGYEFSTSDDQIKLQPSMFIKSLNNVPTHVDINMRMSFLEDRFTGGLTYRLGQDQTLGFLLGTRVDNINLFYTYNVTSQSFQEYNSGTHDVSVRIDIGKR